MAELLKPGNGEGIAVEGTGKRWHVLARLRWWHALMFLLVFFVMLATSLGLALVTHTLPDKWREVICGDLMTGPLKDQVRPPCPRGSVQMIGACWTSVMSNGTQVKNCRGEPAMYEDPGTGLCWFAVLKIRGQPGNAEADETQIGDWEMPDVTWAKLLDDCTPNPLQTVQCNATSSIPAGNIK